jgi:hypothetical protein
VAHQEIDELKARVALSHAAAAEEKQVLVNQRERASALARDLSEARREAKALAERLTILEARGSTPAKTTESQAPNRDDRVAQTNPEPQRSPLLDRAEALIRQGDITGARLVLERALKPGDPQAAFALAETYDPRMLASWRTYGVRAEPARARELYVRAHAGGIAQAHERAEALK